MATIYSNILITKPDRKKQAGRPLVDVKKIQARKVWKQCVWTRSNFNWLYTYLYSQLPHWRRSHEWTKHVRAHYKIKLYSYKQCAFFILSINFIHLMNVRNLNISYWLRIVSSSDHEKNVTSLLSEYWLIKDCSALIYSSSKTMNLVYICLYILH
jgi:hypothetical protein